MMKIIKISLRIWVNYLNTNLKKRQWLALHKIYVKVVGNNIIYCRNGNFCVMEWEKRRMKETEEGMKYMWDRIYLTYNIPDE